MFLKFIFPNRKNFTINISIETLLRATDESLLERHAQITQAST